MNGSTVTVDRFQRVRDFQLGERNALGGLRYKTVNICSLSLRSWRRVIQRLSQHVDAGRVDEFYESVFADLVAAGSLSLQAVMVDPELWCEIDTLEDLDKAETLFAERRGELPAAS